MNEKSDKIKGIAATISFHVVVLLALLLMALKTPLPLPGEEGVEVDLGYADQGMGLTQPEEAQTTPEVQTASASAEPQPEEEVVTQESEETPVVKPRYEEPREQVKPSDTETQQQQQEQQPVEPRQVVNPDAMYKGPVTNTNSSGNQGITGSPGDQGRPDGTKNANNYEGGGGAGDGVSYSLTGRQAKHLPKPEYQSDEQGRIVVTIWVNRAGNVVRAETGAKGTTIADLALRSRTREAALLAVFTPSPDAPELQTGTITYVFIKMN